MSAGGFAAILARLQAAQLRLHCDEALRLELAHAQHQLHDVRAAMRRLRDVGAAARSLGNEEAARAHEALLAALETQQRALGRAVGQLGGAVAVRVADPFVCAKCQASETVEPQVKIEEPLLAKPDAAALSPPRRRKPPPPPRRSVVKQEPRRKLVVRRKTTSPEREVGTKMEKKGRMKRETKVEEEGEEEEEEVAEEEGEKEEEVGGEVKEEEEEEDEEDDDVVVLDDDPESEEEGDVRTRLNRRVDECWPLATSLGALEMPQRRRADYTDLVKRVTALFRTLHECDAEEMASRSMRSVIVKAKDSLAVAVSLLSLHEVTDAGTMTIFALVKAVDVASEKHSTLRKHIVQFRDVLAEFEVVLLTRSYAKHPAEAPTYRKKRKTRRG